MTVKKSKIIKGKKYKRYNGYKTKIEALRIQDRLKNIGIPLKDGRILFYENVRIIHESQLKVRPFVVYGYRKYYRYPKNYQYRKGR